MGEYVTKTALTESIDRLDEKIEARFDDLTELLKTFMVQVDDRFNRLEERMEKLEESHQRLLNTVDGFISRIDHYETEQTARDSQFAKLLVWARKVSKKTGIPLENL